MNTDRDASTPSPCLQAALELVANLSWRVFPLHWPTATSLNEEEQRCSCGHLDCKKAVGKHPRTPNGFKDATTDLVTIEDWWTKWPRANIGVATGKVSGIVALDVDPRHGGDVTLEELESTHVALPRTVEAITGGGGRHLIFAYPDESIGSRNPLLPGLDFKGDGGYIVVGPSLHGTGRRYAWELSSLPDELPLAPLPNWLEDLVRQSRVVVSGANGPICDVGSSIPEGRRDSTLISLAGTMRRRRMSVEAISAALHADNEARCKPPLPKSQVEKIARSIQRYPTGDAEAWAAPTPVIEDDAGPLFPITQAFPPSLVATRDFISGLAHELQVLVDLPAMLLLPIVGVGISQKFVIELRDGWREIPAMWSMCVLDSGERKSAVVRRMTDPVLEWERDELQRLGPEIAEAHERRKVLERMRDNARKMGADDPEAIERAVEFARQLAEPQQILFPSLVLTDVTSEALVEMMVSNGERALIATPEGDAFDVMMGRYDQHGRPNLGVWLKGYTGDRVRVLRRSRQAEYLERPAINIGGAVQPEVVQGLVSNRVARGRGLLARFSWSVPASMVGRRIIGAPPVEETLEMGYVTAIRRLLDIKLDADLGPRVLRLSPEAAKAFIEFETWVEGELAPGGGLSDQRTWGAKLCGAIGRIAMALHCLQEFGSAHSADSALVVGIETARAGMAWAPYLIAHERIARGIAGCSPERVVANRILTWLEREGLDEFSKRDCFTAVRGEFAQRVQEIDEPLRILMDHGYIRPLASPEREGSGRKPSRRFEVNPLWERGGAR